MLTIPALGTNFRNSPMRIVKILPEGINLAWKSLSPYIDKALSRGQGEFISSDIYSAIERGTMQAWFALDKDEDIKAAMVTEVGDYPRLRVIRIVLLSGRDLNKYSPLIDEILTKWAIEIGAGRIETYCRKGFSRVLKRYNAREIYTILAKDITKHTH